MEVFLETIFFFICMLFLADIFPSWIPCHFFPSYPTTHSTSHSPPQSPTPFRQEMTRGTRTHTCTRVHTHRGNKWSKDRKKNRKKTTFRGPREGCGQMGRISSIWTRREIAKPCGMKRIEGRGRGGECSRKKPELLLSSLCL